MYITIVRISKTMSERERETERERGQMERPKLGYFLPLYFTNA